MLLIYIIGPYRASTEDGVFANILAAREAAKRVLLAGAMPVCPHLNTMLMGGVVDDDTILAGDLELQKRCDANAILPGWEHSAGSKGEIAAAHENGQLCAYLTGTETKDMTILEGLVSVLTQTQ